MSKLYQQAHVNIISNKEKNTLINLIPETIPNNYRKKIIEHLTEFKDLLYSSFLEKKKKLSFNLILSVICLQSISKIDIMQFDKSIDTFYSNNKVAIMTLSLDAPSNSTMIIPIYVRRVKEFYIFENKKICMMLVDLLLSYGADINSRFDNIKGYTILIKLVSGEIKNIDKLNTVKEMAKFLLERGADPTLRGKDEKSIIDIVKNSSAILTHYKEELIEVLSNTKQLYFFNDENFIKRGDKIGKGHMRSLTGVPFLNKTIGNEVVFETNEDNMNCCLLI